MEFCNEMIVPSRKFFKLCILAEILGKFYTRRPILNNNTNQVKCVQQTEIVQLLRIKDIKQKLIATVKQKMLGPL